MKIRFFKRVVIFCMIVLGYCCTVNLTAKAETDSDNIVDVSNLTESPAPTESPDIIEEEIKEKEYEVTHKVVQTKKGKVTKFYLKGNDKDKYVLTIAKGVKKGYPNRVCIGSAKVRSKKTNFYFYGILLKEKVNGAQFIQKYQKLKGKKIVAKKPFKQVIIQGYCKKGKVVKMSIKFKKLKKGDHIRV